MKDFSVAIIGGGASGLLCAIELLKGSPNVKGSDIVIIEKNDRVGKKLIATGNGRGNISNTNISTNNYHGSESFINGFIDNINKNQIINYFKDLQIPLAEEEQKIYPLSFQANSLLDIFRAYLSQNNVNIVLGTIITKISKNNSNFTLYSQNSIINAKTVVIATGGKCAKQFGTDGTSYTLAQEFGHKLTPLYPSLVQVKTQLDKIKGLKGIKEGAFVYAYDDNMLLKSSSGDVLFTDYGLSGSAIFAISGYLSQAKQPNIIIDFLPNYTFDELFSVIYNRLDNLVFDNCGILTGIINKKLGEKIIKDILKDNQNIDKNTFAKIITKAIKNYKISVNGTLGFDYAQVTKGGIDTKHIDTNFESKLCSNLYLVGEYINVDGDCGGYNLTFAFYSGITAGKHIKNKLLKI